MLGCGVDRHMRQLGQECRRGILGPTGWQAMTTGRSSSLYSPLTAAMALGLHVIALSYLCPSRCSPTITPSVH